MITVNICYRDSNLEIISKLMNSVALQYDCRINYDAKENTLIFCGDDRYMRPIVEETMSFFRVENLKSY
jgi:hypothetical protein